ncbi:MAG: DUF2846 domain-containing protein [Pseudomonadota bacterium]
MFRILDKTAYLIFALVAALVGCGASGPAYKAAASSDNSLATIYIYRPKTLFNWGGSPGVFLDGNREFDLKMGGYGVLRVKPGKHVIIVKGRTLIDNWYPGPVTMELNLSAGSESYLRLRPKGVVVPAGNIVTTSSSAELLLLDKDKALPELTKMRSSQ